MCPAISTLKIEEGVVKVIHAGFLLQLATMPKLKTLSLCGVWEILQNIQEALRDVKKPFPQLDELECDAFSDIFELVIPYLSGLTSLTILLMNKLESTVISTISNLTALTFLDLTVTYHEPGNLADALVSVARGCTRLIHLRISIDPRCINHTTPQRVDETCIEILSTCLPDLEDLTLQESDCCQMQPRLTAHSLRHLGENCPNLRYLEYAGPILLSQLGGAGKPLFPKLTDLTIGGPLDDSPDWGMSVGEYAASVLWHHAPRLARFTCWERPELTGMINAHLTRLRLRWPRSIPNLQLRHSSRGLAQSRPSFY